MNQFTDLFWSQRHLWPTQQQDYLEQAFPQALESSALLHWTIGDPIPAEGKRILLGVATFSEYDMRLLDLLDAALREVNGKQIRVEVFSIQICRSSADFDRAIPGIGPVYGTPVIGVWEHGQLTASGVGALAREQLLIVPFGLNWAEQQWQRGPGRQQEQSLAS